MLAFGDSNTYGWMPAADGPPSRRFAEEARWPGVMRAVLGAGFEVVEDGLPGRTTDADDPLMPEIPGAGMDGLAALPAVLAVHLPLDLVIVMLGTNDTKAHHQRSAFRIALGAGRLVDLLQTRTGGVGTDYPAPRVLLVAPPPLGTLTAFADMFAGGRDISAQLGRLYGEVARLAEVAFFDAGTVIATDGSDGVHLTAASQQALGRALAAQVRTILQL